MDWIGFCFVGEQNPTCKIFSSIQTRVNVSIVGRVHYCRFLLLLLLFCFVIFLFNSVLLNRYFVHDG